MARASRNFNQSAEPGPLPFEQAFDSLCLCLRNAAAVKSLDDAEPQLRDGFRRFLRDLDMPLAEKNFDQLLREKSGASARRNDGTVNWYHELFPLVMVMSLIRKGQAQGGIDLADIGRYGGLEVLICTHLRHDSVEDHLKPGQMKRELRRMHNELVDEKRGYDEKRGEDMLRRIRVYIGMMTQDKVTQPDGSTAKEDVRDYTHRMVNSPHANPVVFMLKQADIIYNFATMLGAGKFSPERRLKRCNEREDMYGPRYGFADIAIGRWPNFAPGIKALDAMMGIMLYPQFRYLESVDLHYKTPSSHPVGIHRFLGRALEIPFPSQKYNPIHISFGRMLQSVDPAAEPEKHERLRTFIHCVLKPALKGRKEHFPYLFTRPVPAAVPPARRVAAEHPAHLALH